jgi:hypothetical protein
MTHAWLAMMVSGKEFPSGGERNRLLTEGRLTQRLTEYGCWKPGKYSSAAYVGVLWILMNVLPELWSPVRRVK